MQFLLETIAYDGEIVFAAYNQIFQELYNPTSLIRANGNGVNVIVVRFEDWLHYQKNKQTFSASRQVIEQNVNDLISGIANVPGHKVPCIVCVAAPSPDLRGCPADLQLHEQLEEFFVASLQDIKNVYLIRSTEIDALYPVANYYDAHTNQMGHIPYTEEYFAALGAIIVRKIFAVTTKQFKVILSDCDDTLWRGTCGEVGAKVRIDTSTKWLQSFLVARKNEGMVLCLCSKNERGSVDDVFARNSDMILSPDDIATSRINWEPKASNVKSLAKELNLGMDSFVFLDDSPAEIKELQMQCPEVFSVCLPRDIARIPKFIQHLWVFDRTRITKEDTERNKFYKENAKRQQHQSEVSSLKEYIASLALVIDIAAPNEALIPRLAQLSQRTNQFNSTSRRYTEANLTDLLASTESICRYVKVGDRYGDYGIVGLVTGAYRADRLVIDAFLMSCRAMSRGVEYRMMQDLGQCAKQRGATCIEVDFIPSERNKPILDFLEALPVEARIEAGEARKYVISTEKAVVCEFVAQEASAASAAHAAEGSSKKKASKGNPSAGTLHATLLRIANELNSAEQIVQQVKKHNRKSSGHAAQGMTAPENPVEATLCQLYEDLLNLDGVSRDDNFFELGGFSLAATMLSSRIAKIFSIECKLDVISNLNTPKALASYISEHADLGRINLADATKDMGHRFTEAKCPVGEGEMSYASVGEGETVLLLHGLFGRKEHCYEFGSYLAPHFHVVIPDLPGFGDSVGYPKSVYRFASVIDLLEEFLGLLAIDTFHVAGNSMGASLAGVMAARFPHEVLSVAFLGPPSITCPKMSDVERLALEGINISVPRTLEQFHQKIDHLFYVKPRVLSDRLDEIGRDEVANYDSHIEVFDVVQKDDLILDRYIKQVRANTLIIWGDRDRFKDVSGAYYLAENIAHNELRILPDAGHALFQEYPEKIAQLYIEFLGRVCDEAKLSLAGPP